LVGINNILGIKIKYKSLDVLTKLKPPASNNLILFTFNLGYIVHLAQVHFGMARSLELLKLLRQRTRHRLVVIHGLANSQEKLTTETIQLIPAACQKASFLAPWLIISFR